MRNTSIKSKVRTAVKKYETSLEEGDPIQASQLLKEAGRALDKAAQKGVIHRNEASRRISRLTRKLAVMTEKTKHEKEGLA